jgi:hypothetical protein
MSHTWLRAGTYGAIGLVVVFSFALYYSGGDGSEAVPASESARVYGGVSCFNLTAYADGCAGGTCPSQCTLYSCSANGGLKFDSVSSCNSLTQRCGQYQNTDVCSGTGFAGPQ